MLKVDSESWVEDRKFRYAVSHAGTLLNREKGELWSLVATDIVAVLMEGLTYKSEDV